MKKTGFKLKPYKVAWKGKTKKSDGVVDFLKNGFKTYYTKKRTPLKKFREIEGQDSKGNNIWQVYEADAIFATQIKTRDGRCKKCGSLMFQTCSHFFKRAIYSTRFDPDNCDDFCQQCHEELEGDPNGEYKKFKINQLGAVRFIALEDRAGIRVSPTEAVIKFMETVDLKIKDIQY